MSSSTSSLSTLKYALGPGLLMAAAAVGVSHLVQSTRAGADFGFTLVWAVVLANIFKYPFLEFGPRYALATNETMLDGIQRIGKWAKWTFIIFTVASMFTIQAAVVVVTASLAEKLFGIALAPWVWSGIIMSVCGVILVAGQYSALDKAIKIIMVVLTISTFGAILFALFSGIEAPAIQAPEIWNVAGITFLIALMGWMPIPIDGAVWHSIWTHERIKQTGHTPTMKEGLIDFNIGYIGAGVLALAFLSLGALVLFGKGVDLAASGGAFANQLVSIYTDTLGGWSYWVIIVCAFSTMFSTSLTVTDAYPRVIRKIVALEVKTFEESKKNYGILLVFISSGSLAMLYFLGSQFGFMVDLATSLSFLMAPILALINYKLVTAAHVPDEHQPPQWLKILSWLGMAFLTGFALLFLFWKIAYS